VHFAPLARARFVGVLETFGGVVQISRDRSLQQFDVIIRIDRVMVREPVAISRAPWSSPSRGDVPLSVATCVH
jgi:hypothetical protein